jgi:hypothetical protein
MLSYLTAPVSSLSIWFHIDTILIPLYPCAMKIQLSLRIPQPFHQAASAYADTLGVSLNQLILLALADYIGYPATSAAPDSALLSADNSPALPVVDSPTISPAPSTPADGAAHASWSRPVKQRPKGKGRR